jgi:lactoylglutathione lyase
VTTVSARRYIAGKEAVVKGTLENAYGYQGDNMNLPVPDLASALPFYETVLGFRLLSRNDTPHKSAVLARDQVQIGLAESGGDPTQDGCAFHVKDLESLFAEFKANGLQKELSEFNIEQHDEVAWKVFYVKGYLLSFPERLHRSLLAPASMAALLECVDDQVWTRFREMKPPEVMRPVLSENAAEAWTGRANPHRS